MLTHVGWLITDRVVMAEFSGLLTIGDFLEANDQLRSLITPTHFQSFHLIYNSTERAGVDWRFSDLMFVRDLGYRHPRLRSVGVIDAKPHPLASVVGRMAVHFHGLTIHITTSQEDMLAHLYKIDSTLRTSITS